MRMGYACIEILYKALHICAGCTKKPAHDIGIFAAIIWLRVLRWSKVTSRQAREFDGRARVHADHLNARPASVYALLNVREDKWHCGRAVSQWYKRPVFFPQRTVLTMGNCFPEICAVLALQTGLASTSADGAILIQRRGAFQFIRPTCSKH
jgi:hypothetical protein